MASLESESSDSQYSYGAIKNYLTSGVYPEGADKQAKHGLCKRSRFCAVDAGHLHYIGAKKTPRLVVQSEEEQIKIIHEAAHLGRDKILLTTRGCYRLASTRQWWNKGLEILQRPLPSDGCQLGHPAHT